MPGPESLTRNFKALRRLYTHTENVNLAVARIAKRIARHLRGGGGHADLVLVVEAQLRGHFARALARLHHVAFGAQRDLE